MSRRTLVLLATVALVAPLGPSAHADQGDTQNVSYRGVSVTVPAEWPVREVDGQAACVRFDRAAVFLGDPDRSTCPPHLVGRSTAVHITTQSLQGVIAPDRVVTAPGSKVSVLVSAGDDTPLAQQIAQSVTYDDALADVDVPHGRKDARNLAETPPNVTGGEQAAAPPVTEQEAPARAGKEQPARSSASTTQGGAIHGTFESTVRSSSTVHATFASLRTSSASPSDTTYQGLGFDACTAQPLSTMATWFSASPYKAANMYIGGASRGCSQPNLTADWVAQTVAQGWTLIPTYVGLQANCTDYPNRIDRDQAAVQGVQAADDAIVQLNALGLGIGNPVYFDMEAFDYTRAPCLQATQTFLDQWTVRLHQRGYVSGIYSSSNTVKALLVDKQGDPTFHQPDDLWFARWNGDPATTGDPVIPDQYWADHQRIHQYQGGHLETWGGITVNIDNDSVDAAVAPSMLAADGAFVQVNGVPGLYRMAGGAPLVVSDWAAVGGPQPVQTLSQTQFDSLPDRPDDGTFLQSGATGRIWRVVNGVAPYVPSWTPYGGPQPSIVVDQAAIDNAGTGGVWNHLSSGAPSPERRGPYEHGTIASHARFSWFGGYSSSVVTNYDVRWRKAHWDGKYGDWKRPASWQRTAVTNVPLGLRAGNTYCVSVRARNKAGQRSGWTKSRCLARALDDRSLVRSSGWNAKRKDGYFGHTYLTTTRKGATLTLSGARVKRIGVVASTCRSCGKVAVLVDGERIGTVHLAGPRHKTQTLMLPKFHRQKAAITLKVRSNDRVRIDGLVVSRA